MIIYEARNKINGKRYIGQTIHTLEERKRGHISSMCCSYFRRALDKYGVDSFYGFVASVLQGCTDTTVYVLALYFGSIKITKSKYALKVGLFADACGITAAFILCHIFFTK